jgi:hypothetical protein
MTNKLRAKKWKVEFIVTNNKKFGDKSLVNWKWIKQEALRGIFEPYARVSKYKRTEL